MAAQAREVIVGVVGRPHGIRGEVTVEVRTDEPERRFGAGVVLRVEAASPARSAGAGPAAEASLSGGSLSGGSVTAESVTVESVRWHSGRLLVKFSGVPDRTAVEAMRGLVLLTDVDPTQRPEHHEEYYDHQLIGLRAQLRSPTSHSDQAPSATLESGGLGLSVGVVTDVIHSPQQDLLQIRTAAGEERLVPFVQELVPSVDLDAGVVWLADRPGLLTDIDD